MESRIWKQDPTGSSNQREGLSEVRTPSNGQAAVVHPLMLTRKDNVTMRLCLPTQSKVVSNGCQTSQCASILCWLVLRIFLLSLGRVCNGSLTLVNWIAYGSESACWPEQTSIAGDSSRSMQGLLRYWSACCLEIQREKVLELRYSQWQAKWLARGLDM